VVSEYGFLWHGHNILKHSETRKGRDLSVTPLYPSVLDCQDKTLDWVTYAPANTRAILYTRAVTQRPDWEPYAVAYA
jgi:hypothetical protein